jgi:hypothetical protein
VTTMAQLTAANVEIRKTDLFEVWCHALESGEWKQIKGLLYGDTPEEACVLGVGTRILQRAGLIIEGGYANWLALHPRMGEIQDRAAQLLGELSLAGANDNGHSFKLLAAALRRARIDVESGAWSCPYYHFDALNPSPTYKAIIASMTYQKVPEGSASFTFKIPLAERKILLGEPVHDMVSHGVR